MIRHIDQKPSFRRIYKRLGANHRAAVDEAIRRVVADPRLGEEKRGDLAGVQVYKFDCVHQPFLLAYALGDERITLLALGPHENFYRDLKR
jgi:mRNA-degrading endonuclease RelE of RelBE toxin-antitoxin system